MTPTKQQSYPTPNAGESAVIADLVDLAAIFSFFRRRALLLCSVMVVAITLGCVYYLFSERQYRATGEIIFETTGASFDDRTPGVVRSSISDRALDTQVEVLRSASLATAALETNQELREAYGLTAATAEESANMKLAAARDIVRGMEISRKGSTSVVLLSFLGDTQAHAQLTLGAMMDTYLNLQRQSKSLASEEASELLDERLATLQKEVTDAEGRVEEFRAEHGLAVVGEMSLEDRRLIRLQDVLAKASADRIQKQMKLSQFNADREGTTSVTNALLDLQRRLAEAERNVARLRQRYGGEHPSIIAARQDIASIQQQISMERAKIGEGLSDEVFLAQEIENQYKTEMVELRAAIEQREAKEVHLRELQRQAAASRDIYENFLATSKKLSERRNLASADATVLEPARAGSAPYTPKLSMVMMLAGLIGLVGGVGAGLLMDYSPDGLTSSSHLQRKLGLPSFGYIPEIKNSKGGQSSTLAVSDTIVTRPRSIYAESINRLSVMLENTAHHSEALEEGKIASPLLFTSAVSQEGKSSTSLAFARSCVGAGERTILIDADLRRPSVAKYLGVNVDVGIEDVLLNEAPLHRAVIKDEHSNLVCLPATGWYSRPTELLKSEAFRSLINQLSAEFDRVVIDAPPVLAFPEAVVLGRMSAATIVAVRWRSTSAELVRDAVGQLQAGGANVAGAVLTRVHISSLQEYGYYDSKYYTNEEEFSVSRATGESQIYLPGGGAQNTGS